MVKYIVNYAEMLCPNDQNKKVGFIMHFSLIGAPLELGCGTVGCSGAFSSLAKGGLSEFLSANHLPVSADMAFSPLSERREGERGPRYLSEVLSACRDTCRAVSDTLGEGNFPLTIGGDHALGLGTVAGTAEHYSPEELSLIWVDAHTDINTEESSFSGNIHGMPIAALLGLCGEELSSIGGHSPKLRPENVHIFFARDIDPPEEEIIRENGVNLYRMSEIRQEGLETVLRRMLGQLHTPAMHISWDVDSLDSSLFTATGLPIPDGPTPAEVTRVLTALAATGKAVAMDCVEYNPLLDDEALHGRETVLNILKPVLLTLAAGAKE